MSKLDAIKSLWQRAKAADHNTESLSTLLADYTRTLNEVMADGDDYNSLRRLREELPDLQRLITKKHDAILKGRLQDGIGALKKKVEEVEAPPLPVTEAEVPDAGGAGETIVSLQEDEAPKKPFRNMPSIGMD